MKSKTKHTKADIMKSLKKTGGGPQSNVTMSKIDNDVAELIGPTIIHGDAAVDESVACFVSIQFWKIVIQILGNM